LSEIEKDLFHIKGPGLSVRSIIVPLRSLVELIMVARFIGGCAVALLAGRAAVRTQAVKSIKTVSEDCR